MTWYSFECSDPNCPASAMNNGTGVITEIRLPDNFSEPTAFCPLCASQMHFRDHWPASESGHGSHADFDLFRQTLESMKSYDGILGS